jgi:hypothetical protein
MTKVLEMDKRLNGESASAPALSGLQGPICNGSGAHFRDGMMASGIRHPVPALNQIQERDLCWLVFDRRQHWR